MRLEQLKKSQLAAILTSTAQAKKLAAEINDPEIFGSCDSGEYFNFEGKKVFANGNHYKKYLDYLTWFEL